MWFACFSIWLPFIHNFFSFFTQQSLTFSSSFHYTMFLYSFRLFVVWIHVSSCFPLRKMQSIKFEFDTHISSYKTCVNQLFCSDLLYVWFPFLTVYLLDLSEWVSLILDFLQRLGLNSGFYLCRCLCNRFRYGLVISFCFSTIVILRVVRFVCLFVCNDLRRKLRILGLFHCWTSGELGSLYVLYLVATGDWDLLRERESL